MRKVDRYNTLKIAGAALTAVSCIPMLSLLPGMQLTAVKIGRAHV